MLNHSSALLLFFALSVLSGIYKGVLQIWGQKGPWAVGVKGVCVGGLQGQESQGAAECFPGMLTPAHCPAEPCAAPSSLGHISLVGNVAGALHLQPLLPGRDDDDERSRDQHTGLQLCSACLYLPQPCVSSSSSGCGSCRALCSTQLPPTTSPGPTTVLLFPLHSPLHMCFAGRGEGRDRNRDFIKEVDSAKIWGSLRS